MGLLFQICKIFKSRFQLNVLHFSNIKSFFVLYLDDFYTIKCDEQDSKRRHIVAALCGPVLERHIKKIFNILDGNPDLSVAAVSKEAGIYPKNNDCVFETLFNEDGFVIFYHDFSVLLTEISEHHNARVAIDNIFEFIDSKGYSNYPEDHVIHRLVHQVKNTYGWQHAMWWGGAHPLTGEPRTDADWLKQKASASTLGGHK